MSSIVSNQVTSRIYNNRFYFAIGFISFISLVWMIATSSTQGLWQDELYQIGYVHRGISLSETMSIYSSGTEISGPLFGVVSYFWYRIAPNGEQWLLLISEITTCIAIFFIGLIGRRIAGNIMGIFAAVFSATSGVVIVGCGHEFRMYGVLMLFSALLIWVYVIRYQNNDNKVILSSVAMGVIMALMLYTHYLTAIACFAFFICDIFLWLKKRNFKKLLMPYVCCGVIFLPWFLFFIRNLSMNELPAWVPKATLWTLFDTVKQLVSYSDPTAVSLLIFIFGVCVIFFKAFSRKMSQLKDTVPSSDFPMEIILVVLVLTIALMYIFSKVFDGYSVMYIRYLFYLYPYVALISAFGVSYLFNIANTKKSIILRYAVPCALFVFLFMNTMVITHSAPKQLGQTYREAARWLVETEGNGNSNSALYTPESAFVLQGFYEYYYAVSKDLYCAENNYPEISNNSLTFYTNDVAYDVPNVDGNLEAALERNPDRIYVMTQLRWLSALDEAEILENYTITASYPEFSIIVYDRIAI